ncbi:MAG: hypothetical protein HY361_05310 [Candidatus Aenigmarchaeota archaeon]|nr:hypothetical protein [Candidatus Aenigmarchaeota archaeon]
MGIYLRKEGGFSQAELELTQRTMLRYRDFYADPNDPYVFLRHGDNASIQLYTTQIQLDPRVINHTAVYKLIELLHPTYYLQDVDAPEMHDLDELWGSNEA